MADVSGDYVRGFLMPWPFASANLWAAQAGYTQNDARAGVPVPSGSYGLGIQTAGTQSADLLITTQKGGHPEKGGFVWRQNLPGAVDYGKNAYSLITAWESKVNAISTKFYTPLDSLELPNGTSLVLVRHQDSTTIGDYGTRIYKRGTDGSVAGTDLHVSALSSVLAQVSLFRGALCSLPDGSILAAHTWYQGSNAQLMVWRSTDDGATWQEIADQALPSFIDTSGAYGAGNTGYQIDKIRMKTIRGNILLIFSLWAHNTSPSTTSIIRQYVSVDEGASFVQVGETDGSDHFAFPELLVSNGRFVLCYCSATDQAEACILPTAYSDLDTAISSTSASVVTISDAVVAGGLTDKHFTTGQLAAWTSSTGQIYIIIENVGSDRFFQMTSNDRAGSWQYVGSQSGTPSAATALIWDSNTSGILLTRICASGWGAAASLWHNTDVVGASGYTSSLYCATLGGYATVNHPSVQQFPEYNYFPGWQLSWQGIDDPGNYADWGSHGAGSLVLSTDYITLTTGVTQKFYEKSLSGDTFAAGIICRISVEMVSGGSNTQPDVGMEICLTDNVSKKCQISVCLTTTEIRINNSSGVQIANATGLTLTDRTDILIAMTGETAQATVSAWYRATADGAQLYNLFCNAQTVATAAGTNNFIDFGHPSAGTAQSRWYEVHLSSSANYCGLQLADGFTNPTDLHAQIYPGRGQYIYVEGGLYLTTYDGPARKNDSYAISTRYQYPIDAIFHSVSPTPQITWRSAAVSSGAVAANFIPMEIDITIGATAETPFGSPLMGVHLNNINFQSYTVERYDVGTTAWVVMATVDNAVGSFTFTRAGAAIKSTSGTGPYLILDESKGWTIKLDDGAGNVKYRHIRTNAEGKLSNQVTKQAVLYLSDVANTDPTSGTATLIPNTGTCIIDTQGETGSAWGIRIPSQETADLYFKIGNLSIGRIVALGTEYGRGRELSYTPGAEINDQTDGIQRARKTGPGFRTLQIAWTEGVDVTPIHMEDDVPDYITATTAGSPLPIAAANDIPDLMMGLCKELAGAVDPVVYLPSIVRQASLTWNFNRSSQHMLCTLQDDITIESMLGNENSQEVGTGEVFRVARMQFREVI